jgi:hypothetical protein
MAKKRGDHVMYVPETGSDAVVAHVLKVNDNGTLNLQTPTGVETGIPHREKEDYDESGGGRTWHET